MIKFILTILFSLMLFSCVKNINQCVGNVNFKCITCGTLIDNNSVFVISDFNELLVFCNKCNRPYSIKPYSKCVPTEANH